MSSVMYTFRPKRGTVNQPEEAGGEEAGEEEEGPALELRGPAADDDEARPRPCPFSFSAASSAEAGSRGDAPRCATEVVSRPPTKAQAGQTTELSSWPAATSETMSRAVKSALPQEGQPAAATAAAAPTAGSREACGGQTRTCGCRLCGAGGGLWCTCEHAGAVPHRHAGTATLSQQGGGGAGSCERCSGDGARQPQGERW